MRQREFWLSVLVREYFLSFYILSFFINEPPNRSLPSNPLAAMQEQKS